MKIIVVIIALFICSMALFGQTSESSMAGESSASTAYKRNALSVMVLDIPNEYNAEFKAGTAGIVVPDKFDDNNLMLRSIKAAPTTEAILAELNRQKTVNRILAKWFARDSVTGNFNMSVVHQRGMYNATDDEVVQASASKIGIDKLKDAGELLINGSYVLVLQFSDIMSMTEVYNRRDVARKVAAERANKNYVPVRREKNGWVGNVKGYLYKVNFSDSVMALFYNDMWIYSDDSDSVKQAKKQRFEEADFPLQYVAQVYADADGTQYEPWHPMAAPVQLTRNQLFEKMINTGLNGCVKKIEISVETFKVKAPVYSVKPISAKVGKKEGLKTDQRYYVFEAQQNQNGQVVLKRKAAVRVKKAVDNRKVATGNSTDFSTFYQVAGLKIEPGMTLYQQNDFGIGLSGGMSFGEIGGGWGKLELNVARMASSAGDIGITQLKLFGYLGFETKAYDVLELGNMYDVEFIRLQAGISKGFYLNRCFSLAPFIAFGSESGSNNQMNKDLGLNSGDFIGAYFFNYGLSGNFNLTGGFQIYGCATYYAPFSYIYTEKQNVLDFGVFKSSNYTDVFSDRKGLSFDVGIRLEF